MIGGNTDTRQKLIDTAMDLIWKSSYGAVSVDDICTAAEVKKGSFYHFFPSKVDLAVAAMDEAAKAGKAARERILSSGKSAMERLDRYVAFTYQMQAESIEKYGHVCGCPSASLASEMACQESRIREKAEASRRQHERHYEEMVKDFVAEGLLPQDTSVAEKAQKVHSYVTGLLTTARIENDLTALKRDLKPGILQILGVNDGKRA
jgi:TetR/AcrR family transcriptional repressor of nem operon